MLVALQSLEAKKRLIELGANVDVLDSSGRTLFDTAEHYRRMQSVESYDSDVSDISLDEYETAKVFYFENGAFVRPGRYWLVCDRDVIMLKVLMWERVCEDIARMVAEMLL